eukprot:1814661-Alexandrium_andersonii.AAC.1
MGARQPVVGCSPLADGHPHVACREVSLAPGRLKSISYLRFQRHGRRAAALAPCSQESPTRQGCAP